MTKNSKLLVLLLIPAILIMVLQRGDANADSAPNARGTAQDVKAKAARDQIPAPIPAYKLPQWPLRQLSRENRAARLNFFSNQYDFHISKYNKTDPKICQPVLNKIKDGEFKILNPAEVLKDQAQGDWRKMKTTCENLNHIRMYTPLYGDRSELISNPEFMNLPPKEQAQRAPAFFEAAGLHEYYDLSGFLGAEMWGYIGEGAVQHCRADKQSYCDKYVNQVSNPYIAYEGSVTATFNAKTCQADYDAWATFTQRLVSISGSDYYHYGILSNFSAFAENDNKLYLINFRSDILLDDFDAILNPDSNASLIVIAVEPDPSKKNTVCGFDTR